MISVMVVGQRKVWIDVTKGIGIIAVVAGHVLESHLMFLWHMPLFFLLAGYNYRYSNTLPYLLKLTKRLLLPYFACLFVGRVFNNTLISFLDYNIKDALYGGARLKGCYAVFWFVTVLYMMLISLHLLSKFGIRWWMVCVMLAIGYIPMYYYVELPWNLQVVPMAFAYGSMGFLLKKTIDLHLNNIKLWWAAIGVVVLSTLSLLPGLSLDMKYNDFGVPVASFILSLLCVIAVFELAKWCETVNPIASVLSLFGRGSMVVMYSHMLINLLCVGFVENKWIRLMIVLLLSIVLYVFGEKTKKIVIKLKT